MLTISETFKKILSVEIVDMIVRYSNKKAEAVFKSYNEKNPDREKRTWKKITREEMYAFFGILISSGANNSNTDHVTDMWKKSSFPLSRATMGRQRFQAIIRFIRFDDQDTRRAQAATNKSAPVSEVWEMLNANLAEIYKPTCYLAVDEQLYPYRGRTRFTQYMPSKPAKYGIKVWWICDAENGFPLKGIIYLGKIGDTRDVNQGERIVKELASMFKGSGRNISTDRFFTTLPLAKFLLSWNLTIVGTLKSNKTYIPQEMKASKSREPLLTLFGFQDNVKTCSYVPKKKSCNSN